MLRSLFPGLTADRARGADLFRWATKQARDVHWYRAGAVEDSVDGRFAMLATAAALLVVRLEGAGDAGRRASAALTERFIEAMEAEHREMGLGDPKLGRTVRKLVGSLEGRVAFWRSMVVAGEWTEGARQSIYRSADPSAVALSHAAQELRALWNWLQSEPDATLTEGNFE